MRNHLILLGLLLTTLLLLPATTSGQEPALSFKTTEVAPGLYMIEGVGGFTGGNLGLLTGDDGVVLIDDGLPPLADKILGAIAEVTEDPVEFLINTHVHGDHIGGNEAFGKQGATIVAHDQLRARLMQEGWSTPDGTVPAPEQALPVVTFSDSVTFHLNDHEAVVFHVERAHTDGDAVIHFRKANVLHTGDVMFNKLFPFIDMGSGGTVAGYLAAQKHLLSLTDENTKIIPGHGPLASRQDLEAAIAMLEDSNEKVRALVEAGKTADEIVAENPLASYHEQWNWGFITTERMTRTLIRGLASE